MKQYSYENYTCMLGENAAENWELLSNSDIHDIFFHLTSFPSGYVILSYKEQLTTDMIRTAATICKNGTKYRNLFKVKVDYCEVSNVTTGSIVGEVIYKSNRKVKQIQM